MVVPASSAPTLATSLDRELGVNTSSSPIQFVLPEVTACVASVVEPSIHLKVMLLLVESFANRALHFNPLPTERVPAGMVTLKTLWSAPLPTMPLCGPTIVPLTKRIPVEHDAPSAHGTPFTVVLAFDAALPFSAV
jgi:hypothetical protein